MNEPEILPDYRTSPWLCFGATPAMMGDPKTPELFTQALAFLESVTSQFNESGPWPQIPAAELYQILQQHNRQAQTTGYLPEGVEVTLIHVKALSQRRLLAFEETGWHLTHYDHRIRFVDRLVDQAIAGTIPQSNHHPAYQKLLANLPEENLVEEDEPDYPDTEADGSCRTCANGQPCRVRIEEDISEILSLAGLPLTNEFACLKWMLETGCSSLTHSIAIMAEEFAAAKKSAIMLVVETGGNELLVLPGDPARPEGNLLELVRQEANRLNLSIEQINLRFAAG